MITKVQAIELAVRYNAYLEAVNKNDDLGVCVWGDALLQVQEETGIKLLDPKNTQALVDAAKRRQRKKEAA